MRFADPQLLWLLLVVPLGWAAAVVVRSRRRRDLLRFDRNARGQLSVHRRAVKALLLTLAWSMFAVALARPQWGARTEAVSTVGADVVIVLDTSLSMAAEDLAPTRLAHAQQAIATLVGRLDGHRVGLVTFAGRAERSCPLTLDHAAMLLFVEAVDAEAATVGGTALADALRTARTTFGASGAAEDPDRGRAIVLFTDGEDHLGALDAVLDDLAREGIAVHAVGCGSAGGVPIPLRDPDGRLAGYKKDGAGRPVSTRLDEALLEQVTTATGGRYVRATASEVELDEIAGVLSGLTTGELSAQMRTRYEERFYVPLALALIFLAADTVIGDRARRGSADGAGAGRRAA